MVEALLARKARVTAIARDAKELAATAKETGAEAIPADVAEDSTPARILRELKPDLHFAYQFIWGHYE